MAVQHDERNVVAEDNRLQPDPELREGKASAGKIALTVLGAIAIMVLVVYGLTHKQADPGGAVAPASSQTAATPVPSANAPPAGPSNASSASRPNNLADQPSAGTGKQAAQPRPNQQQAGQPADQVGAGSQPGQPAGDSARANKGNETTGSAAPTERPPAPAPGSTPSGAPRQ